MEVSFSWLTFVENKYQNIMAKYNLKTKKERVARYQTLMSEETKDYLKDEILKMMVNDRIYRDNTYSSSKMAADLNTNSRYISAVCATRFHKNYNELVNDYRIDEAMNLLSDKRYQKMSIEDISIMVGFNNRQSFYANFYRRLGTTPRAFRLEAANKNRGKKDSQ